MYLAFIRKGTEEQYVSVFASVQKALWYIDGVIEEESVRDGEAEFYCNEFIKLWNSRQRLKDSGGNPFVEITVNDSMILLTEIKDGEPLMI